MITTWHVNAQRIDEHPIPYPFRSSEELLQMCGESGRTIADLMLENEKCWRSTYDIRDRLLAIAHAMHGSIARDDAITGEPPVPIRARRRAAEQYRQRSKRGEASLRDPQLMLDAGYLNAIAVNEGNTACGLPASSTGDAAGVIPAVLQYYRKFVPGADDDGVVDFLLTAAAVGILHREKAPISAAGIGKQGENGVACSMAAAGLAAVLGGSNEQIRSAMESGLAHYLGASCDPVDGLEQISCIEPKSMGVIQAINAARMALRGHGHLHASQMTRICGRTLGAA
ncbi:L-serine ammonia-lyase, iron-sulfur-dependent, subunit alpha [Cupriavidus sp. WKF15]|uniref:L-serine ammonia-lyase, iron-sulfur-dependent, subunit alpha n=1 Tax=Cupriavidus sp. WKF15 TaxID=3032282 RepID=UPI0023E1B8A7|nr:L-serine ammonia-lyase, iron-sulfur-dependent, subunit alpha [Cupriavidus sp. WKF15]WER50953.1 L-serine ammonia-lyase, iron-sulfur-dependent, subunit alpha [Cupriavidus sp. WKF15]